MTKRIEVMNGYPTTTMDPYDSAEEEAQWILGHGAESDIQNEPADHEAEGEDTNIEEPVIQHGSECAIEGTSHILLPSLLHVTPFEHYQPPQGRRVVLPPDFPEVGDTEGSSN